MLLETIVWDLIFVTLSLAYKPVIIMHGLNDGPDVLQQLKSNIKKVHPETNVTLLDIYDNKYSIREMWTQVEAIKKLILPIMQDNPDGVHLIGFSQGGLILRGVIQSLNSHNVQNFISISSPQAGQYGDTYVFRYFFPVRLKEEMYRFFYSELGQHFSVGNYWNDPHHHDLYLNYSNYLPVINNERKTNESNAYRENFMKLKNVILIGGPDDGVITPWQSSHFAAYNANETVVEIKEQKWYKEDWFGLKTLDQRNALHIYEEPHTKHHEWIVKSNIFQKYIEPWLT